MATPHQMEHHPDLVELRDRYDRAAGTPQAGIVEGITLLAGLYAAVSPWVIGFGGTASLAVNDLVMGIAVALLALGFTSAYSRTHNLAWTAPVVGAWFIVSPWVILGGDVTTGMVLSNVIAGGVIVLITAALTVLGSTRR